MSETDIATRLDQSQVKLLITDHDLLRLARVSEKLAGAVRLITLDNSPNQLWESMEQLLPRGRPDADLFRLESEASAEDHDAFLNRTSGSTGNVKSVLTSHAHFIATMEGTVGTIPNNTDPEHDVWLSPLSLGFFINAKLHMGLNILLGIPVVFMNGPLDETTVDVIGRHQVSFLFITPPIAARLARADLKTCGVDVSSVKWLLTAGAPMHENLRQRVSRQFGGVHLDLEWGTSETMLIAIQRDDESRRSGYSGTLVNGMQAKVISTVTGQELGIGEAGEILVRNQLCRFKGYKHNKMANRDFDTEGWFHTGDYGYLDENCNVFILDRIKELLKVGDGYGTHISAAELEAVVFEHPAVASAVVVGIRNDFTQLDEPTAFVVLKPEYHQNTSLTQHFERDILRFANQKLTGLQRLTGGVRCLSQFPTTGFKINRRQLKQMGHARGKDVASGVYPFCVPNYSQSVDSLGITR
jgi:acyl-coenzyme A synthetase/AMP-(fatty) acid ligase